MNQRAVALGIPRESEPMPVGITRVLNRREVVEKSPKTRLLVKHSQRKAHGSGSRISRSPNHDQRNPLTAVNPSSEPW